MTDRDDELRRKLGWTGPEETDFEPSSREPEPTPPPRPPAPPRPPVEFPAPEPPAEPSTAFRDTQPFTEADRAVGGFRPPQSPYGPPPGSARDTGPLTAGGRPDPGPWGPQQPVRQPPRPPQRPGPPPQPGQPPVGQWPAPEQRPPGSFAERIRADELVPARRAAPTRGWRLALYRASFGLINVGPGPEEVRQAELEAQIRSGLRGHYKVGVMGKGGVGKTTVSASVGSVFAELRQDDRVVAIDADTAFGKLGSRVDPRAQGSYWELASDQHLETFADVRSRVGNNAAGLFVLAGEGTPARRRVLDPAIYREATSRLDRHFTISIIDCSSTMDSPVTQEVLRDLDALIVVSSPWVDGAAAAGQTLDWLAARGLTSLLQRTVIVLNDSDGHADKRTRSILAQQFSSQGQRVIEVPFDGHLRPGGVISGTAEMSTATRRRFLEIAAALAEHFPTHDDRSRDRF
ncbi:MinD-like ATPase involved in chromosome partitioning or flagellar assembly [Mycolicibacterium rutilum]|uniref:MinD-like ATPase involved in chromosome partitioning or flagellar assembly n=1 Tax=Mycolicibacterium rutilum TaxID=370526 RepID=A0A1H6J8W7_MYCRU|nr:MinD/ParA family protein [Mycolicibacterium rutilum]SEH56055.1 MinD-like ATPase involved in chromosome partitioning or flagellar assembly [Mycolicibacterium rutilum]